MSSTFFTKKRSVKKFDNGLQIVDNPKPEKVESLSIRVFKIDEEEEKACKKLSFSPKDRSKNGNVPID